ncbi:hypothetical protein BDV18DRAFT_161619 [Aspergillus unguis]
MSDICTHYGYSFEWTKDHTPEEQLVPYQYTYDTLASEALEKIEEIAPPAPPKAGWGWGDKSRKKEAPAERDMYALLRDNKDRDETLKRLWDEVTTVPDWVDWDQLGRGQDVLYRYAGPALLGFALHGLVGSTGASSRPAETLVRTGGHSVKVARHRFFETFQLMLQVTQGTESIKSGGDGFAATVRVRFLHATVRNRILKLAGQRPGYYSTEKGGIPINDLDCIQSVCAFSTDLLFMALPSQGVYPRQQEIEDYIALWRWVGYVIGAPVFYMDTATRAKAMMESVMLNAVKPSDNSRVLIQNILKALDNVSPIYASRDWWEAGGRVLNGDELSDAIGLGKPSLYYRTLIRSQSLTFKLLNYFTRSIPAVDRWWIDTARRGIWAYVIESKDGLGSATKFEFKYVPDPNERTGTKKEVAVEKPTGMTVGIETVVLLASLLQLSSAVVAVGLIFGLLKAMGVKAPVMPLAGIEALS